VVWGPQVPRARLITGARAACVARSCVGYIPAVVLVALHGLRGLAMCYELRTSNLFRS
jgi:hypothetical protein